MGSISTRRGDDGSTSAPGGERRTKADLRVEAAGCIDELKAAIGVGRALCRDPQIDTLARDLQRDLFPVASAISTKPGSRRPVPEIGADLVAKLDALVETLEAEPNIKRDWSLPGELAESAGFELARTVARRAERATVRLVTAGESIAPTVLAYLNRLSDVLWLFARVLEARAGVDARLRDERHPGPPFSRAW